MDVMIECRAGIDIGKDEVVACVRTPGPGGRGRRKHTRTFTSFTASLEAMADWSTENQVTDIVMEASGSYWKPVWYAWAAARTRDTYLAAQFWRLARRIGKKKAAVAVAHSILVISWHLLTNDCDYDDLGGDWFTRRNTDRQRDRLITQLQGPGYYVCRDKIV